MKQDLQDVQDCQDEEEKSRFMYDLLFILLIL